MAEIVNLRQHRKRAARERDEKRAEANRTKHGIPKALRRSAGGEEQRRRATLDAHRLEHDAAASGPLEPDASDGADTAG